MNEERKEREGESKTVWKDEWYLDGEKQLGDGLTMCVALLSTA